MRDMPGGIGVQMVHQPLRLALDVRVHQEQQGHAGHQDQHAFHQLEQGHRPESERRLLLECFFINGHFSPCRLGHLTV